MSDGMSAEARRRRKEGTFTCGICGCREERINEVRLAGPGGGMNVCTSCHKQTVQHTWRHPEVPEQQHPNEVTRPRHYTDSNIEAIEYIKDKLGPAFKWYCIGNVIKYVSRAGKKGPMKVDLQKAKQYIEWAIENAD